MNRHYRIKYRAECVFPCRNKGAIALILLTFNRFVARFASEDFLHLPNQRNPDFVTSRRKSVNSELKGLFPFNSSHVLRSTDSQAKAPKRMRTRLFSLLAVCLIFAYLGSNRSQAQSHDGSIEDSWNRAAREPKPLPLDTRRQSPPPETREQQRYTTWERIRPEQSRPWPFLPKNPSTDQYYTANKALIDSLSNLYCLSANYITTLTNRNEAAMRPASTPQVKKDFHYDSGTDMRRQSPPSESLDALHKELMQLLDRCLYGN